MPLPYAPTEVSYNGYTFPSNIVTTFTETPEMSEDGRVIKWSKVTITVKGYIGQGASPSSAASAIAVIANGMVTQIIITSGGSGYLSAPNIEIVGGSGSNATATATVTGGTITSITVTNGGFGYLTVPTVTIDPPAGGSAALATSDSQVEQMRRLLCRPGRRLVYTKRGSGTDSLIIDPAGPIRDVAMGPTPGPLKIKPLGGFPLGNITALFEWSVEAHLEECTTAVLSPLPGVFTQIAYTVEVSINEAGYSVITHAGSYEIPLSLQSNGVSIVASADAAWDRVVPQPINGFQRTTKRTLSADRKRVEFVSVDTQQPGKALPRNIVHANLRQRLHNQKAMNILDWSCTISGDITVAAGVQKSQAWLQIYDIIAARIAHARRTRVSPMPADFTPPSGVSVGGSCVVLIQTFDISDSMFTDDLSFTLTYRLLGSSIADILDASGMWLPINTDWASWTSTMVRQQSPRGIAGWRFNVTRDFIIDLCNPRRRPA